MARHQGGLFSVALSLGSPLPGVTRHLIPMEPGLSSIFESSKTATIQPSVDFILAEKEGLVKDGVDDVYYGSVC